MPAHFICRVSADGAVQSVVGPPPPVPVRKTGKGVYTLALGLPAPQVCAVASLADSEAGSATAKVTDDGILSVGTFDALSDAADRAFTLDIWIA